MESLGRLGKMGSARNTNKTKSLDFSFIVLDLRLAVDFHCLGKTHNERALVKNEGALESGKA